MYLVFEICPLTNITWQSRGFLKQTNHPGLLNSDSEWSHYCTVHSRIQCKEVPISDILYLPHSVTMLNHFPHSIVSDPSAITISHLMSHCLWNCLLIYEIVKLCGFPAANPNSPQIVCDTFEPWCYTILFYFLVKISENDLYSADRIVELYLHMT